MVPLAVAEATASSHYTSPAYGPDGLGPRRLIDGDRADGGWISDVRGGENAWLEFRLVMPARIRAVEVVNGFLESSGGYYRHMRPRDVRVSFPGIVAEPTIFSLADHGAPQVFEIDSGSAVDRARIDILSLWRESPDPTVTPYNVVGLRHVEWRGDLT